MTTLMNILVTSIFIAAGARYIYAAIRSDPRNKEEWYDGDNWPKGH